MTTEPEGKIHSKITIAAMMTLQGNLACKLGSNHNKGRDLRPIY
jgi:hypothetical protein